MQKLKLKCRGKCVRVCFEAARDPPTFLKPGNRGCLASFLSEEQSLETSFLGRFAAVFVHRRFVVHVFLTEDP